MPPGRPRKEKRKRKSRHRSSSHDSSGHDDDVTPMQTQHHPTYYPPPFPYFFHPQMPMPMPMPMSMQTPIASANTTAHSALTLRRCSRHSRSIRFRRRLCRSKSRNITRHSRRHRTRRACPTRCTCTCRCKYPRRHRLSPQQPAPLRPRNASKRKRAAPTKKTAELSKNATRTAAVTDSTNRPSESPSQERVFVAPDRSHRRAAAVAAAVNAAHQNGERSDYTTTI